MRSGAGPAPLLPPDSVKRSLCHEPSGCDHCPRTVGVNKPAPAALTAENIEKACRLLATLFGGFTALEGKGGYLSETFGLVVEPVTVVYASCDGPALSCRTAQGAGVAADIAECMSQECVAVECDGALELISPRAAA